MKSVVEILSDLVSIPSASSLDNTPIIELISGWFPDHEKTIQEWTRKDSVPGKNLIVKIPGVDQSSSLVFVCHMDTVPTSSEWETDPFKLVEKEEKLYGLGSCDTKGGVAALIHAVLNLEGKPATDTYLVFSGDEEVSCSGVKKLKEDMFFANPSFVFLEPTDRKVLVAQRGLAGMTISVAGKAQHASYATPEANAKHSAIYKMSKILDVLIKDAEEMAQEQDEFLGSNTQNLGVINGGTARNVMPDKCTLSFDRRILPKYEPSAEIVRITELLKTVAADVEVSHKDILPSFNTKKDAPLPSQTLNILKKVYLEADFGGFQAWSEAGLFAEFENVIILGPGSIAQAHKANEFIDKKELESYSPILKKIIMGTV